MKIYRIAELQYQEYNPDWGDNDMTDEEWGDNIAQEDLYEQGRKVFEISEIRPDSTKDIRDLVLDDGTVVGSTAWGWNTYGDESIFAFDIAIKSQYRSKGIGTKLVERAISKFESERDEYEDAMGKKTAMRIEAVNMKFGEFLARKYGFTIEKQLSDRIILYKS